MLIKLASQIILVYFCFLSVHWKVSVAEGLGNMMLQQNLLFAQVDSEIEDMALKYFYEHALQWPTPIILDPSVFAEVPPYTVGAVKTWLKHEGY